MPPIVANLNCPSCQAALRPKLLACDGCGIQVEGPFVLNEFATLSADDLHLLRIFVLSEGRIRDMEAPLGLSYPTIRTRLRDLRQRIAGTNAPASPARGDMPAVSSAPKTAEEGVTEILARLEEGELSFDDAMAQIKRAQTPADKKSNKKDTP